MTPRLLLPIVLLLCACACALAPVQTAAATPTGENWVPTSVAIPECPYLYWHYTNTQSYPIYTNPNCYPTYGTQTWITFDNPPLDHWWSDPTRVTVPVTTVNGQTTGTVTVPLPSGNTWAGAIRRYDPGALVPVDVTLLPTSTITPIVAAGGVSMEIQPNTGVLRFSVNTQALNFPRDTYYMLPMYDYTNSVRYMVVARVPKQAIAPPVPHCSVTQNGPAGTYRFTSTSTDPTGIQPTAYWSVDGGSNEYGNYIYHSFTTPGDHDVKLTAQGVEAEASTTCHVRVPWPTLTTSITYRGSQPPFAEGGPIPVRVTVRAVGDDAIGAVEHVGFTPANTIGGILSATGPAMSAGDVVPGLPPGGATMHVGDELTYDVDLTPAAVGRYTLATAVAGSAPGLLNGNMVNFSVGAQATSPGEVGEGLDVSIALTPPDPGVQDELSTEDAPDPVDVTATISFTNHSGETMDSVRLEYVKAISTSHTAGAQDAFDLERIGGTAIPPEGLELDMPAGGLADGQSLQATYVFRANDDEDVEFSALATGTRHSGQQDFGEDRQPWKLKPKYLLAVKTQLVHPANLVEFLPAGDTIRIKGTVQNLSGTDTVTVGPLYPELAGNAGAMSLTWDAVGTDPDEMIPVDPEIIKLAPRQTRTFTVRITTGWSDPVQLDGQNKSGGVFADITFTPWAQVTDEDGVTRDVDDAEIKADPAQLGLHISIDDSITIPELEPFAYAGAIMYGGAQGVKNAAISVALAPTDVLVFCYTSIAALAEYQTQVWNSFTDEEKDQFSRDVASLAVVVLKRNAAAAAMAPSQLYDMAYNATGQMMTQQANDWAVGDWTKVVEDYSSASGNVVGQVVFPIMVTKLAKSAVAVKAIQRAQKALQTTFESTIGIKLITVERMEELAPLLDDIKSGTELRPEQLDTLYGISPEELEELQRLSTKYNFLLTVRSRHASSLKWLQQHAMMKPEALKIKSVSEMDTLIGYNRDDIGRLVFRKPKPLASFEADGGQSLAGYVDAYLDDLQGQGIIRSAAEREDVARRLELRMEEWKKYELGYKRSSKLDSTGHGYLDVSFNWKGNAIDATTRKGTGKYVGFKMVPVSGADSEEYVMQMMEASTGHWRSITGDIDPIAFTHLDGSPLSQAEHADLLDDMIKSPLLRAQHPESATFVGAPAPGEAWDGVKFVAKQFKPDEAALQIAPGGLAPRAVRLNKLLSEWNNPFDYHLHWDGGFVYAGTAHPRGAQPLPGVDWQAIADAEYQQASVRAASKITPAGAGGEATLGICKVRWGTGASAKPLILTGDGQIAEVAGGTSGTAATITVQPTLTDQCFSGDEIDPVTTIIDLSVSPTSELISSTSAHQSQVTADQTSSSTKSPAGRSGARIARSTTVSFQVGQDVVIDAGGVHAEIRRIIAISGSRLTLDTPLSYTHVAKSVIVVLRTRIKPHATTAPRISGKHVVGKVLRCSRGRWTGTAPLHYTWSWERRVGKVWKTIRGARKSSYRTARRYRRTRIRCVVAASNLAGSTRAMTPAVKIAA